MAIKPDFGLIGVISISSITFFIILFLFLL